MKFFIRLSLLIFLVFSFITIPSMKSDANPFGIGGGFGGWGAAPVAVGVPNAGYNGGGFGGGWGATSAYAGPPPYWGGGYNANSLNGGGWGGYPAGYSFSGNGGSFYGSGGGGGFHGNGGGGSNGGALTAGWGAYYSPFIQGN